jgi:hypothetical protein
LRERERATWREVGIRLNLLHVGGLLGVCGDCLLLSSRPPASFSVGFLGCDSLLLPRLPLKRTRSISHSVLHSPRKDGLHSPLSTSISNLINPSPFYTQLCWFATRWMTTEVKPGFDCLQTPTPRQTRNPANTTTM